MARPLRIDIKDGWYHITARGIDRREIFDGGMDNGHFLELLQECVSRYKIRLHAYCLMGNHYHLLIQTPHANASKAMQWLNVSYGVWYNRKHDRVGPLFQGRFGSKLVDGEGAWALDLSVYIHLNPVRVAGLDLGKIDKKVEGLGWKEPTNEEIKARLARLRGHPWSSYRACAGYVAAPQWLTCERLWEMCRSKGRTGQESYRRYVESIVKGGKEEDLASGFKVALAIGSTGFVEKMKRRVSGDHKEQPDIKRWQRLTPFENVIKALEKVRGERWEDIKGRHGDDGRDMALLLGRRYCGLSLKELGESVGDMEYHAVSKALSRMARKVDANRGLKTMMGRIENEMSNV